MWNDSGHKFSYDKIMDEISSLFIFATANIEDMEPISNSLGTYLMTYPDIELSSRLIGLAVQIRIIDDRIKNLDLAESYQEQDEKPNTQNICGTLNDKNLSLREACNKIIHARDIRLDDERKYLLVNGCHGKEDWNAKIDLNKFLSYAFNYINDVSCFDSSYYPI